MRFATFTGFRISVLAQPQPFQLRVDIEIQPHFVYTSAI